MTSYYILINGYAIGPFTRREAVSGALRLGPWAVAVLREDVPPGTPTIDRRDLPGDDVTRWREAAPFWRAPNLPTLLYVGPLQPNVREAEDAARSCETCRFFHPENRYKLGHCAMKALLYPRDRAASLVCDFWRPHWKGETND